MNETRQLQRDVFERLLPEWPDDLLPTIQQRVRASNRVVVALDDDPTGTQTVHGLAVLTEWPIEKLHAELCSDSPAFYLLTNTRSLPPAAAHARTAEIGAHLQAAAQQSGRDYAVISRGDSTLRGHFPGEVDALALAIQGAGGQPFDAWLVVPFFPEGGRFTIDDVHYVAEGEWLTPAAQTEFARDAAFGYQSSNLREWVAEKTAGRVSAQAVASISLGDLRQGGPDQVAQKLLALPRGAVCIANAASYRDLEVLVLGLLEAESRGWRCLYRSAASFVRVRAGIAPQPLLDAGRLPLQASGAGLIVAGSYVPKTGAQLEALLRGGAVAPVEVQAEHLLSEPARANEIARAASAVNALLQQERDTLLFTSRRLIGAEDAAASLAVGQAISTGLVEIVRSLRARPRYLLAKGGITSSDIATAALGIRRAVVLGQILPGVPVWRTGPESRFPGLTYIVFPGNVGSPDALLEITTRLRK